MSPRLDSVNYARIRLSVMGTLKIRVCIVMLGESVVMESGQSYGRKWVTA